MKNLNFSIIFLELMIDSFIMPDQSSVGDVIPNYKFMSELTYVKQFRLKS